ncbi:MAG TPA: type II toxin-antitoxin system Phd/YefM family antitoxin [Acetobacteraceae bacterium]|nr:type II toxin-antitoxin system Phd/YefM family antitoxin [Acetobacteraceae bacterium]
MKTTTITSRQFNQDTSGAKKAAAKGPVFITDRGRPAHVLMSIAEYRRLIGEKINMTDELGQPPGIEDVALDLPAMRDTARAADFT